MNKKEINEIKRRFKKEGCSIQRMAGCYVDAEKNKLCSFTQTFLNLEDEEFYKYLDVAKKAFSGTLGNNLINLEFPIIEEEVGGRQQILMALRASKLQDEGLLDAFYDHVIDTYDFVGNYLITIYYDVYDVPLKGTDELAMDESDETYEYLVVCINPVALSKAALGYLENENKIGARIRDWVVGVTDTAFVFPAFNQRSTDIHSTLVYTKNAKEPHEEFWENGLGCATVQTATQKKDAFENMVVQAMGPDNEDTKDAVLDVQQNLNDYIEIEKEKVEKDEPIFIDGAVVEELLTDAGIPEQKAEKIKDNFDNFFEDNLPDANDLLDARALKNNEIRVEKKHLQEKVVELTNQLEDAGIIQKDGSTTDIIIKVDPEKVSEVSKQFVDGRQCIVIPIGSADSARVNGEEIE
ncbi:MAG: DUF4317 domain-containing protein [Lachnospiraceae bacterium]|nr:DUF4317 domain-containing protein [Lachnospiraceae bacterium]